MSFSAAIIITESRLISQNICACRRAFAICSAVSPKNALVPRQEVLTRGRYPIEERYIRNNYVYNHEDVDKVLAKHIPSKDPAVYTKPFFDEVKNEDDVTKMQYADIRTWLVQDILVKADRMSMANSLELRVPFLDREMLKIALQIPSKYRVNKETTKLALRGAAAKELPPQTAAMRKTGF